MKEIKLTQGKMTLVDDEDFEKLNQFKWYAQKRPNTWRVARNIWVENKRTAILMHREIMNAPEHSSVDHINGNPLDNCKENLRLCTHQQNMHNQKSAHKNNKLGIKGVRWYRNAKKFRARITINGKVIHLGYFNVMGDADSAYRKAEEKYFGEFARCNN